MQKKNRSMRGVRKEINYSEPCSNATDKAQLSLGCTHLSTGKHLRCSNSLVKYGNVTATDIEYSVTCKSVTIIIFVEFIDQLTDYPINCTNLN